MLFSCRIGLRCAIAFVSVLVVATQACADQPLSVENLFSEKGRLKVDATISYANSEKQGLALGEPLVVQTGPTSFVTLPASIGERRTNTDAVVGTAGLRYGVTRDAEVFGRTSWLWSETRTSDTASSATDTTSRFADAWLGVNYRFRKDAESPALLGFAEVALRERHQQSSSSGKSFLFGLTTYRVLDPVVLSLTAAIGINRKRNDGGTDYKPGNLLLLSPSVAFAANERVSLTTGLQWSLRQADRFNDVTAGMRRTSTDLALGLGYGLSSDTTLNLSANANISGSDGASVRLNLIHTFGGAARGVGIPVKPTGKE